MFVLLLLIEFIYEVSSKVVRILFVPVFVRVQPSMYVILLLCQATWSAEIRSSYVVRAVGIP